MSQLLLQIWSRSFPIISPGRTRKALQKAWFAETIRCAESRTRKGCLAVSMREWVK
jgi:hypothetical protein